MCGRQARRHSFQEGEQRIRCESDDTIWEAFNHAVAAPVTVYGVWQDKIKVHPKSTEISIF